MHYPWSKFIFRFYHRFAFKPTAKVISDAQELLQDYPKLYCTPKTKGIFNYFKPDDLSKIKEYKPDFFLRFGFGILKGEILDLAEYGIWSFHHGDELKYRGAPPAFWEIYNNEPFTGAILQRLTDKLDAGYVLRKGYYKTIKHSWESHLNQLYFESSRWPLQACRDIQNDVLKEELSNTRAKIYKAPNNLQMLKFAFIMGYNKTNFHIEELLNTEDWNTAVIKCSRKDYVENQDGGYEINWLKKTNNSSFFADVFLNKNEIYFENYCYKEQKGKISKSIIDQNGVAGEMIDVLEIENHLSYPFVFENQGAKWCIPESFQSGKIDLYRFNNSVQKFEFHKTLVNHVEGIDTTLHFHDNYWWLFFTQKDFPSVNLYIYYSENFDGPYLSHSNNPVKSDIRSSRPAGKMFEEDGVLYRPVQDCSQHYGARTVINIITDLSPITFDEKEYKIIEPIGRSDFNQGLHTLNGDENFTVIDGKRFIFVWSNFVFQLKKKSGKLIKKFTK
ncbi:MAG: hypothetical protein JEZ03_00545 [Bacteroidales bacterium]|nr:hypothetical protein [Bacteroidales bacterium]